MAGGTGKPRQGRRTDDAPAKSSAEQPAKAGQGGESEKDDPRASILIRHETFRQAADHLASVLSAIPAVAKVTLFGSVAVPPVEERPRSRKTRHEYGALPHEAKDIDLAVWLDDFTALGGIRKAIAAAMEDFRRGRDGYGVCSNHIEVFLHDAETGRYGGRLCHFHQCPKGDKFECRAGVAGGTCGKPPHLRLDPDFRWYADTLSPERSRVHYVRPAASSGYRRGRFSARGVRRGKGETTELLAGLPDGARVERIISRGKSSPPDFRYDQTEDEWVMLTAGTATVAFEDRRTRLRAGDWLFIPAHCRHRVASASEDAVWLAVFLPKRG